jgi:hypothetical protein
MLLITQATDKLFSKALPGILPKEAQRLCELTCEGAAKA